jgi:malate permease and related proteins
MFGELIAIFFSVLAPVFLLVLLGYLIGPRLNLDARTLSRLSYFVLTPAFIFDVMSGARIEATLATRMTIYIIVVHVLCAALAFAIARVLGRDKPMIAAYMLLGTFGNVGNFGIPIVQFAFQEEALVPATVYFLAVVLIAFVIGVWAANWARQGNLGALAAVLRTPALIALPPALLYNWSGIELPVLARPVDILAGGLIPVMLVTLGVQLADTGLPRVSLDMVLSSAVKLVACPALAILLAAPFSLAGLERATGVLQAAMPAAVFASIIAFENDLLPSFVTASVLFSTIASLLTLTVVIALL